MGKNRAYPFPPLDPSAARILAYLDGLPPSFRFGDLRQAKVNALREPHKGVILQSASGEELSPALRYGDGAQSALTLSPSVASGMPSVLDRAFKGEL